MNKDLVILIPLSILDSHWLPFNSDITGELFSSNVKSRACCGSHVCMLEVFPLCCDHCWVITQKQ